MWVMKLKSLHCRLCQISLITFPPGIHASCETVSGTHLRTLKHFPPYVPTLGNTIALKDSAGTFQYNQLLNLSMQLKDSVLQSIKVSKLGCIGERIAFITPNNASYTVCKWAIWMCGSVAVPLCSRHPTTELEYILRNSQSSIVISSHHYEKKVAKLCEKVGAAYYCLPRDFMNVDSTAELSNNLLASDLVYKNCKETFGEMPAMIIYTSGTTGRPKGVLHMHNGLSAQVEKMIHAWEWNSNDVVLHVLPLHHVHGIVNVLMCPLSIGATVVMEPDFNADRVWNHLLHANKSAEDFRVNIFMAVPTIYAKLIEHFHAHSMSVDETREKCKDIRLMVSGSASMPVPVLNEWKRITGHTLLERYGMTEFGMGLTNKLHGKRVPGAVGLPFPDVSVKIVPYAEGETPDYERYSVKADYKNVTVSPGMDAEESGELLVKTNSMFEEYWNNPEATKESFVGGWFKTGDTAKFEGDVFRILGRTSVDIIKSGGYKISALDIERHLLEHPSICEVAVLGVPDEMWGQRIAALVRVNSAEQAQEEEIKTWCRKKMPSYQIPKEFIFLPEIPKNLMGKVNKKDLLRKFYLDSST